MSSPQRPGYVGDAFAEPESVTPNWLWLIRIPPQSDLLLAGPITDAAASVIGTHFTATYRWSGETADQTSNWLERPAAGVGMVIVTEPWPAVLSQPRVAMLEKMFRALRVDGCLLLLTDEAIVEASQGVSSEAALRSIGFSRVRQYLVEPAHATPRSIVPLNPSAIAQSRAASGGLITVPHRSLKDRLLGREAPRCIGLTAYR